MRAQRCGGVGAEGLQHGRALPPRIHCFTLPWVPATFCLASSWSTGRSQLSNAGDFGMKSLAALLQVRQAWAAEMRGQLGRTAALQRQVVEKEREMAVSSPWRLLARLLA